MNLIIQSSLQESDYKQVENQNLYKIVSKVTCEITVIPDLTYMYVIHPEYHTDFRSGPSCVLAKQYIEQIGAKNLATSWLIHDINYDGYLPQKRADKLLYHMLLHAPLDEFKSQVVFFLVTVFGGLFHTTKEKGSLIEFNTIINKRVAKNLSLTFTEFDRELKFDSKDYKIVEKELLKLAVESKTHIDIKKIQSYYK